MQCKSKGMDKLLVVKTWVWQWTQPNP